MNEVKAIKLCIQHRNTAGFEFLVKNYRSQAFAHAFGFMGNREDAADACQDAFKKAFVSIVQLDQLDRFYPWFYCILRNHCFNLLSRKKTAATHSDLLENQARQNTSSTPRKELEHKEENDRVQSTLASLKEDFREILVLKYFSDFNYQQISETLQIPRGTVMSRLYHARTAFKNQLENTHRS